MTDTTGWVGGAFRRAKPQRRYNMSEPQFVCEQDDAEVIPCVECLPFRVYKKCPLEQKVN